MDFRHAFFEMLSGRAVRLPDWAGYWVWENGTIMMHDRYDNALDIRQTTSPGYTFSNIASNDWEVCEPQIKLAKDKESEVACASETRSTRF